MTTIGIVGGGQLARMLALAGYPLGLRFVVLDPAPDACAGQVAELIPGAYDDPAALAQLAARSDVVTFDFENVPAAAARVLTESVPVYPPPAALATAQDRLSEKTLFQQLGIPTPAYAAVDSPSELNLVIARLGLPAVLKTRRLGYDGKGQRVLRAPQDISPAWRDLSGNALILEGFVPFEREVSLLAARSVNGATVFYPLTENRHRDGILRVSQVPCQVPGLQAKAQEYVGRILERLEYVGLLAVEFFVQQGRLLANEMAPRVHNSGHWTIEGAQTSQFENHLRAILGLPLGSTALRGQAAMVNFIGQMPERAAVLATGAHYHDYGKAPRTGRKVGHATLQDDDIEALQQALVRLEALASS